jgi:hypothetical protein
MPGGKEGFVVSITPTGIARQPDEASGPDDINVTFWGYPTGLIGGVDPLRVSPRVLFGILRIGAPRTDPSALYNIGEYFFVVEMTSVAQKREWFTTVRERLAPPSPNEGAVLMGWKSAGYCRGTRSTFGDDAWTLECQVTPNVGNRNYFRFVSDGPIPP